MEQYEISIVIFGDDFKSSLMTIYSVQNYLDAGTYKIFLTFPQENNLETTNNIDKTSIIFADDNNLVNTLNKIFEISNSKYILFLSAGIVLSSKTLNRLSAVFDNDKKIGAVGPLLNYCHYHNVDYIGNFQQISTNNLKNLGELEQTAESIADKKIPNRNTLFLDGKCILMKREVADIVGVPDIKLGIF